MLQTGARLGPYTVVSPLGKGGMGEVYRATDPRLGRDLAIKVLPEDIARNLDAMKRFEREARALAALSHPNIVIIHDVGNQEGVFFVVMELLEGESLRWLLTKSSLPWKQSVDIAIQTAEGLAAAHSKGVIHRDLKPENIFCTSDGRTKILDFGLAQLNPQVSEQALTQSVEMKSESVMGTIPYMSPEQLRGAAIDSRTDIFSFGTVLYEMVAGKRPFAGNTTPEIFAAILQGEPEAPLESGKAIPPELDRLIMRCLEKKPERRFQSAADLAFGLKELSGASRANVSTHMVPKRRLPFALWKFAAAIVILILISAALFYFAGQSEKTLVSLAVLPFVNSGGDPETEYLSDGITESLINQLSRVPELKIIARTTVFTYKGKQMDPQKIGDDLSVRAVLMGRLVHRGDDLVIQADLVDTSDGSQIWGDQYKRKIGDLLKVQQDIAIEITNRLKIELTPDQRGRATKNYTQNTEAFQLYLKGRFHWNKRSEEGLKKAMEFFQQAIEKDPVYAPAYAGIADVYLTLFDYEILSFQDSSAKARASAQKALQIDEMLGEAHNSMAHWNLHNWKWVEAEAEFKRAIELDPGYAPAYHWYSLCLTSMGRTEEAVKSMEKALELDPLSLRINADLGMALLAARRPKEAIEQERKTLELDANYRTAYWIRGMAYEQTGQWDQAIEQFQEALKRSPGNPNFLAALGHVYGISGKKAEASEMLKQMHAVAKQEPVSPFFFALVHTGLGEKEAALEWIQKAYEQRSGSIRYLKVEPRLDTIRSDPKFADLMHRVGLQ